MKITPAAIDEPAEAPVWTMLFSRMGAAAEQAQHAHRDDGRGNGGRHGQAGEQAEVGIGGGQHHRQHDGKDHRAEGELRGCSIVHSGFPLAKNRCNANRSRNGKSSRVATSARPARRATKAGKRWRLLADGQWLKLGPCLAAECPARLLILAIDSGTGPPRAGSCRFPRPGDFLCHPKGVYVCFFTEMWERFSFYGMKALLLLYLTKYHLFGDKAGLDLLGAYGGLVYCIPVFGCLLADRWLGMRKAVVFGGISCWCWATSGHGI